MLSWTCVLLDVTTLTTSAVTNHHHLLRLQRCVVMPNSHSVGLVNLAGHNLVANNAGHATNRRHRLLHHCLRRRLVLVHRHRRHHRRTLPHSSVLVHHRRHHRRHVMTPHSSVLVRFLKVTNIVILVLRLLRHGTGMKSVTTAEIGKTTSPCSWLPIVNLSLFTTAFNFVFPPAVMANRVQLALQALPALPVKRAKRVPKGTRVQQAQRVQRARKVPKGTRVKRVTRAAEESVGSGVKRERMALME